MKLAIWLFFNALVPLSPVLIVWGLSWLFSDAGPTRKVFSIIKEGQVFFYCTAISSAAIGDVGRVPKNFETVPWIMGLLFIIILSTVAFAAGAHNKDTVKEGKFGWSSIAMAVAAIATVVVFRDKAGLI